MNEAVAVVAAISVQPTSAKRTALQLSGSAALPRQRNGAAPIASAIVLNFIIYVLPLELPPDVPDRFVEQLTFSSSAETNIISRCFQATWTA
jgi:hypothetical protein